MDEQSIAAVMQAQYANTEPQYGDQYAEQTANRTSYGDVFAGAMMGARTVGGGAVSGAQRMFADLGARVMPTHYTPPARIATGYYGQYVQNTGFVSGAMATMGTGAVPRGTTAYEHYNISAGDFGERVGSGLAAAGLTLGATALATTAVASAAGGMIGGAVGGIAGSMIPIPGAGLAGAAVGRFLGSTIAPYAASAMANTAVLDAVSQRKEIQNTLESSSFRFIGAGSALSDPRGMGGMSRGARQEVTDFIRKTDVADPMVDTKDLTTILSKGTDLGLFAGTSSMVDFKKKFKDITESVKTVTQVLHTTLEEGLKVIKDLKSIAVDPSMVKQVVQSADAMGKMSGRTGMEMVGIGLQGAEMFRGTGVTMGIGFQANMMNVSAVRAARDAGTLSQEAISQAGGEEALGQRMTASSLGFTQTMFGRGMGAAFYGGGAPGAGGGGFNKDDFSKAMMGGTSFTGMFMQGASNMRTPAALRSYMANQEKFTSEMGAAFGGKGLEFNQMNAAVAQAQWVAKFTKAPLEDELVNAFKEQGLSRPEIDARIGMMKGREGIFQASQEANRQSSMKLMVEENAQNLIFNRIGGRWKDIKTAVEDAIAKPVDQFTNAVGAAAQQVSDYTTGITRYDVSDIDTSGVGIGLSPTPKILSAASKATDISKLGLSVLEPAGTDLATPPISKSDFETTRGNKLKELTSTKESLDKEAETLQRKITRAETAAKPKAVTKLPEHWARLAPDLLLASEKVALGLMKPEDYLGPNKLSQAEAEGLSEAISVAKDSGDYETAAKKTAQLEEYQKFSRRQDDIEAAKKQVADGTLKLPVKEDRPDLQKADALDANITKDKHRLAQIKSEKETVTKQEKSLREAASDKELPEAVKKALNLDPTTPSPGGSSKMPTGLLAELTKPGKELVLPKTKSDDELLATMELGGFWGAGTAQTTFQEALDAGAFEGMGIDLSTGVLSHTKRSGLDVGRMSVKNKDRPDVYSSKVSAEMKLTEDNRTKIAKAAMIASISLEDAQKMVKPEDAKEARRNLAKGVAEKGLKAETFWSKGSNTDDIALAITGKHWGELDATEFAKIQVATKGTEFEATIEKDRKKLLKAKDSLKESEVKIMHARGDEAQGAKKDIEEVVGISDLPKGVAEGISRAQLAGTKEERKELMGQVGDIMLQAKRSTDLPALLAKAGNVSQAQAGRMASAAHELAVSEAKIGSRKLSDMLATNISKVKPEDMEMFQKTVAEVAGGKGLLELTNEQRKAFSGTEAAPLLESYAKDAARLEKAAKMGDVASEKSARAIIEGKLKDPEQQKEAMRLWSQPGHSIDEVKKMMSQQLAADVGGPKGETARGGGGGTPVGTQGTAAQNESIQMQTNLTTLAIMESLAKRLGYVK